MTAATEAKGRRVFIRGPKESKDQRIYNSENA